MKNKVVLATGMGIGYVMGTRAGRAQYEKIRAQAQALWQDPKVQSQVSQAKAVVKEQAPMVQGRIVDVTKKVTAKTGPSSRETELNDSGSGI